jgi:hypothetical protein
MGNWSMAANASTRTIGGRVEADGAAVGNPLLHVTRNAEVTAGWSLNRTRFYLRPEFFYSFLDNLILVNDRPQRNMMSGGSTGDMMTMAGSSTARSYANVDARSYGSEMA